MLRLGVLHVIPAGISLRPAQATDLGAGCRLLRDLTLPVEGVQEWWERFTVAESTLGIVGLASARHGYFVPSGFGFADYQ